MQTQLYRGRVLVHLESEDEARFLLLIAQSVDRKKLAEAAAKLSVQQLDDFNKFVFYGLGVLFEEHVSECRGQPMQLIADDMHLAALDAYDIKKIQPPA